MTCLKGATVSGAVTVASGASRAGQEQHDRGSLTAHRRRGRAGLRLHRQRRGQDREHHQDVTIAGNTLNGGLALSGNTQVTANERYSRLAGAYGPILAGNTLKGTLDVRRQQRRR